MRDRFRPYFCTSEFYLDHQSVFERWKSLFCENNQHKLLQNWALGLLLLRRPRDWFGGFRQKKFAKIDFRSNDTELCDLTCNTPIKIPKNISSQMGLNDLIRDVRIKPIPEVALKILAELPTLQESLLILNYEPEPFELLKYQCDGKRVVTFDTDYKKWPWLQYGERDVLSFIIHDLIHAFHFFSNEQNKKNQIGFYRLILKITESLSFKKLYQHPQFAKHFNYIISDMNAHPVHLLKTLRAHLSHFSTEQEDQHTWRNWTMDWSRDHIEHNALLNINTPLFNDLNAYQIESICTRESYNLGLL